MSQTISAGRQGVRRVVVAMTHTMTVAEALAAMVEGVRMIVTEARATMIAILTDTHALAATVVEMTMDPEVSIATHRVVKIATQGVMTTEAATIHLATADVVMAMRLRESHMEAETESTLQMVAIPAVELHS